MAWTPIHTVERRGERVSQSMVIRDRRDAGERLSERLGHYEGGEPLIWAVPRGAVPMGRLVADRLGGELDVALVSKLGAPHDPETAIGSIDEQGTTALEPKARRMGYSEAWLERETAYRLEQLRRRAASYRAVRPASDPAGRTVIVVDDGAATGSTLEGAIRLLRRYEPMRVVVAVAVMPRRVERRLRPLADEVVCLHRPWLFVAVNQAFKRFPPVEDEEVVTCLRPRGEEDPRSR